MSLGATVAAVDLGAESGRIMAATLLDNRVSLQPVCRFANGPVQLRDTLYWDVLGLWREIERGIETCLGSALASVGVDAWGVDFGLLDRNGRLLGNPVHYRDVRTEGMFEVAFRRVAREEIYRTTGIQFMSPNTLYQLLSLVQRQDPVLEAAETFLTIPDLFNYWLTGEKVCEFTNATTTQFYDPRRGGWAVEMLTRLGIPTRILPPVVPPGTRLGAYRGVPVIAPASHDTGSAVAAVPSVTPDFAYISSGTWSLIGLETRAPIISDKSYQGNLANEGGLNGTFRFLKDIMGLWLVQQCRAAWASRGKSYDYEALAEMAAGAPGFRSWIDPDDPPFLKPGDMSTRIASFCERTGQPAPASEAEVIRCILESLALKYRYVLALLEEASGRRVEVMHIVGGGSRNHLLCQMTANAIGRPVIAGPDEATALGNALAQWLALGMISSHAEGRRVLRDSVSLVEFEPKETEKWDEAFERFQRLVVPGKAF